MELVSDYMRDPTLRHALNELTQTTFGFDFETWVTGGFFEGDYIPYSFIENGKVISNVSVNRMRFLQNGVPKYYVQLGTVMTAEDRRGRGLARKLMQHVLKEYEPECDGVYLFGDLDALDFYRKTGFATTAEYRYTLREALPRAEKALRFKPIGENDEQLKQKYREVVKHAAVSAALEQTNKFALQMFYTADCANVHYSADLDCFIVLEADGDTQELQSIICEKRLPLSEVISRLDGEYNQTVLGFVPQEGDRHLFSAERSDGGDSYLLFYRGAALESIEREKLIFPAMSHA